MTEKLFRSENVLSRTEIAENIRSIADGIEEGNVSLKSGTETVSVQPRDKSELEVEVEREDDGDTSIEIEV
jgi:amphi-Trp domain-containing protein